MRIPDIVAGLALALILVAPGAVAEPIETAQTRGLAETVVDDVSQCLAYANPQEGLQCVAEIIHGLTGNLCTVGTGKSSCLVCYAFTASDNQQAWVDEVSQNPEASYTPQASGGYSHITWQIPGYGLDSGKSVTGLGFHHIVFSSTLNADC